MPIINGMNGFFIIIEISGLQQFLNVKEPAVEDLIQNCNRSLNNTMRAEADVYGSFIIFAIDSEMSNGRAVYESAVNLLEIVGSYSEDIHEYTLMLIYRSNITTGKVAAEMRQNYFMLCTESALMVENKIAEAAGLDNNQEDDSGFYIQNYSEQPTETVDYDIKKLLKQSEIQKITNIIVPEIDSDYNPDKIILQGDSELVIRTNLREAVKDYIIYIDFLGNETEVIMPFARSVDPEMIPIIEKYLDGVELKTWNEGLERIVNINSDFPEEYFFGIYCLYLKGVLKYLQNELKPQLIVISGINQKSGLYMEYAARIMEFLYGSCSPVVFIIDSEESENRYPFLKDDFFRNAVKTDCCRKINPSENLKKINYQLTRLFFTISLTEGLFNRGILFDFLTDSGYNSAEISSGIRELQSCGCIIDDRFIRIISGLGLEEAFNRINEKEDIYNSLATYISRKINKNVFFDYGLAARRLAVMCSENNVSTAVYLCLNRMLDLGKTDFVIEFLDYEEFAKDFQHELASALKLRAYMLKNEKAGCLDVLNSMPEMVDSPENMNTAMLMLETSRYFHAANDYKRSLELIKKVLIYLQDADRPEAEGTAFIELGFLMLCKGKLLESSEYLNLAVERLTNSGESFNYMKALIYSAVNQYLWGGLDTAEDFAEKALGIADAKGYEEWSFYIRFFICRLYFELGRYYDAERLLSDCLLGTELFRNDKRRKIFSAWTARACIYQGKIYRGINMLLSLDEDPEVLFFLAEAYYFNGSMEKAVSSIEKASAVDDYFDLGFLPLEHISWKNGFSSVEGRVLRTEKGTGVLLHNIRALHAFMLGLTGNREYGMEILFSLTRDERISENDPFNRLYFYFYCQLMERRQNVDMVDKLTLISKALKYLQQTSSRIIKPQVRKQFMTQNYWNSKLVSEAKREKLL